MRERDKPLHEKKPTVQHAVNWSLWAITLLGAPFVMFLVLVAVYRIYVPCAPAPVFDITHLR